MLTSITGINNKNNNSQIKQHSLLTLFMFLTASRLLMYMSRANKSFFEGLQINATHLDNLCSRVTLNLFPFAVKKQLPSVFLLYVFFLLFFIHHI